MCSTGNCKSSDTIWGIVNEETNKLHRLTFSKSLAEHIIKENEKLQLKQFSFKIGRELKDGETSKTGLYGIIAKSKFYALRISLIKDLAELLTKDESRILCEIYLEKV